jgi:NADH dehydrogenase/NADH:ubiquinone oxidoreductase subunit G
MTKLEKILCPTDFSRGSDEALRYAVALAREVGVRIPTPCYDRRLKPCGNCRRCLAGVKGAAHPVTACTTKSAGGM